MRFSRSISVYLSMKILLISIELTFLHLSLLLFLLKMSKRRWLPDLHRGLHVIEFRLMNLPFLITPTLRKELIALGNSSIHSTAVTLFNIII
jgi:hypothetical protein